MVITEVVFTALFILVIAGTTRKSAIVGFAGIPIGLMLALIHMITIPIDNTSVNPARSFSTVLFGPSWGWEQLWVFIVFPIIGGLIGALIWRFVTTVEDESRTRLGELTHLGSRARGRAPQAAHSQFSSPPATLVVMAGERLLLVDDEDNLRSMLEAALRYEGFDVHAAASGRDALDVVEDQSPDLIVLDVMMPDLDGFEVCRRLRNDGVKTPVLFLTARDATEDKVRGLTLGGDDYLVKPFSLDELVARISAVLRRSGLARAGAVLRCADLEMDDDAHVVRRAGDEVPLSPTEYNLLRFLLANQGRVLSKPQILDHVWQYDFGGDGGVVETYIGYLRKKIDRVDPRLIHTVRGFGYALRER